MIAMEPSCCQVTLYNPPSSQKVISGNWRIGSAMNFSRPNPAEKIAETAMPESTSRSTQPPNCTRRANRYDAANPASAKKVAESWTTH